MKRAIAWVNGVPYLLPKGSPLNLAAVRAIMKEHGKPPLDSSPAGEDDIEVIVFEDVKVLWRADLEDSLPWCEPCCSYHAEPRDKAHHEKLQCKAPVDQSCPCCGHTAYREPCARCGHPSHSSKSDYE